MGRANDMQDIEGPEGTCPGRDPGAGELALRGLKCPLPVLHTRKALRRLRPGQALVVRCTDPLAGLDIPNLLRATGDVLVEMRPDAGGTRFEIRKA